VSVTATYYSSTFVMAYTFDQKAIGNRGAKAKNVREDGKREENFSQARNKHREERSCPGTDN